MANSRKPGRADPLGLVRAFLRARVNPGSQLCLGLSGGLDSSVLLHLLAALRAELDFQLSAVHVHHGLVAEADAWADFCRASCAALRVPLAVHRVVVEPTGEGLEGAARAARYRVYAEQAADFIVLAHHRDDQVETFFLHLLRGAGVHGLAAMPEERVLGVGLPALLRPLLGLEREVLCRYAAEHGIGHVDDASNRDLARARNWLRQMWLPALGARYPAYRRQVAGSAAHLAEGVRLLDEIAAADLAAARREAGLDLGVLANLGQARARNLLRHWLAGLAGMPPPGARLDELLAQMLGARADAQPEWRWQGLGLIRAGGTLCLADETGPAEVDAVIWDWHGEAELTLGCHGVLVFSAAEGRGLASAKLAAGRVRAGWRQGGERLQPDCRRPRRALKKLFQEAGILPPQRRRLPLLYCDDRLVWAAGIGSDCALQAAPDECGWVISWRPAAR